MRTGDTRTRKIICYARVGIASGEPEVVPNSGFGDSMATPQVHVIGLLLSDLTLLARRRDDRRQLAGTAFRI